MLNNKMAVNIVGMSGSRTTTMSMENWMDGMTSREFDNFTWRDKKPYKASVRQIIEQYQ